MGQHKSDSQESYSEDKNSGMNLRGKDDAVCDHCGNQTQTQRVTSSDFGDQLSHQAAGDDSPRSKGC